MIPKGDTTPSLYCPLLSRPRPLPKKKSINLIYYQDQDPFLKRSKPVSLPWTLWTLTEHPVSSQALYWYIYWKGLH